MNQIFKTLLSEKKLPYLAYILSGIATAKLVSLGALYFTEKSPVLQTGMDKQAIFENYKFSTKFGLANKISANATTQNWKLRAIFKYTSGSFIIFEDSSKTVFLSMGESYGGYKLDEIGIDKAKLSNGGASFELKLDKKDGLTKVVPTETASSTFSLSRVKFEKYAKNMGLLADEVRASQTNDGVLINSIAKESFFLDLGLKEGDTIVETNGNKISSFSDIMGIFKDPEKTKLINIIIKRQNLKKELSYEIN